MSILEKPSSLSHGAAACDAGEVAVLTIDLGALARNFKLLAERVAPGDVTVTNDIPLAERVLKAGGAAIAPNGRAFTEASIGSAIAQRALMEQIRSTGEITGGPRPFAAADRSQFLQAMDQAIQKELRRRR